MFNTHRVHILIAVMAMSLFSSLSVSPVMAQPTSVQGAIAPGNTSAQNPVVIGGVDNDNKVRAVHVSPSGILSFGASGNGQDGYTNSQLMYMKDIADVSGILPIAPMIFNPQSGNWDRQRFCEKSVVLTATGVGSNALITAVSGKSVFICSIVISGDGSSAAGAAYFTSGTNSDCSSGTTNLTNILRAPAFDSNYFGSNSGYFVMSPASHHVCVVNWHGGSTPVTVTYTIY